MKRQIRRGVFETNSSSVHSLTMCNSKEYDEFQKGNMFIERWGDSRLYTKEELIEKFKNKTHWNTGALLYQNIDWNDDDAFKNVLSKEEFCTSEEYWDRISEEYETFKDSYTSKDGEKIYAFGYYGHD